MPTVFGPLVEVAVGGLVLAMGLRSWRRRGLRRARSAHQAPRSDQTAGLVLGFLATLADLPTAGPLLAATALLGGTTAWRQVTDLALYNVVYISPLVAIALAHGRDSRRAVGVSGAGRRGLLTYVGRVAVLCLAGAIIGSEGTAALL